MRKPNHIAIIPDGNRRYAHSIGLSKDMGYEYGITPGLSVFKLCEKENINEVTFYGFTVDNTKRPSIQKIAFIKACIKSVLLLTKENCEILVVGDTSSKNFPKELLSFTNRKIYGSGGIKVNFLINYAWQWDLNHLKCCEINSHDILNNIGSSLISRIDLVIRWGGRRRLSGLLPVQSVYSDFFVIDDLWPDFKEDHFYSALTWYNSQDVTLGG